MIVFRSKTLFSVLVSLLLVGSIHVADAQSRVRGMALPERSLLKEKEAGAKKEDKPAAKGE